MMKRRNFLRASLGMGAAGLAASGWRVAGAGAAGPHARQGTDALQWRDRMLLGFGTVLSVRVAHTDSRQAERALDAAVETIRHVEAQMSLFDPDSALNRLNREGVLLRPHPDLSPSCSWRKACRRAARARLMSPSSRCGGFLNRRQAARRCRRPRR